MERKIINKLISLKNLKERNAPYELWMFFWRKFGKTADFQEFRDTIKKEQVQEWDEFVFNNFQQKQIIHGNKPAVLMAKYGRIN